MTDVYKILKTLTMNTELSLAKWNGLELRGARF